MGKRNMETVIIVDDEKLIREGIKKNIDWDGLNLYLIGEAENGLDAIYMIEQHVPDILLLDICMPMMDGLELAKAVKQRYPRSSVIMVTGYDEFNFVREALTIGVEDYILKPVTQEKLTAAINSVKEKRENNIGKGMEAQILGKLMFEKKICDIIKGSNESIKGEALPLSFDENADIFCVAILQIEEILGECWAKALNKSDLINFAILNIANELLLEKRMGFAMLTENAEIIIVFSMEDEEDEYQNITDMAGQITEAIENFIQIQICIGIGEVKTQMKEIGKSFSTAITALDFRFIDEDKDIISYEEIKKQGDFQMSYPHDIEAEIIEGILNEDELTNEIMAFFAYIKIHNAKLSDIKSALFILISAVLKFARDYDVVASQISDNDLNIMDEINSCATLTKINEIVLEFIHRAQTKIKKNITRPKQLADKIEKYIFNNYTREELSLNMMAKELFISTSYISAIFKNDIGKSFVDYLTQVRVEKAKNLLLTSQHKTYEVGAMVGYRTPQYFSTIFKKETGDSPSQYRKKIAGS